MSNNITQTNPHEGFKFMLFLIILLTLFLSSCKKNDKQIKLSYNIVNNNFFNNHRSGNSNEDSLINYLERLNEKNNFVGKTVAQIGYPRWDKLIKKTLKSNNSRGLTTMSIGSNSNLQTNVYYIPFVRDSQNYVNASMVLKTSANDTTVSYVCDWQYANKPHGSASGSNVTAERIASFFMLLDHNTLGHNRFEIKDSTLFQFNGGKNRKVIGFKDIVSNSSRISSTYEVCIDWYYCATPEYCANAGGCDYLNCISDDPQYHCSTMNSICQQYWDTEITGSTYTPPSNNFGDGGGGFTPPNPCGAGSEASINSLDNSVSNCMTNPGWVPISNTYNAALQNLSNKLNLNPSQINYLLLYPNVASELISIMDLDEADENIKISAERLVLSTLINNSFDEQAIINEYNLVENQNITDPIIIGYISRYFSLKYAALKQENSTLPITIKKNETRILYETFSGSLHLGLDVLGLIPIGGEVFDVLNGLTYTLEGDKTNAYLSYASAISFAGYAASGIKAIKAGSVIVAVIGKKGLLVVGRKSQSAFRKACGAIGEEVGHHIMPFHMKIQEHPLMQMAYRAGFDHNNAGLNGISIHASLNSGNHNIYADKIFQKLENIYSNPPVGGFNPNNSKGKVIELINQIKASINANPGIHVDNLNF